MKKFAAYLFKKILWLSFALLTISVLLVASLNVINPPTWMWKLQRQFSPPADFPATTQHQWVDWNDISEQAKLAVIAAEDQLFPKHSGFDFDSIAKALKDNRQGKRIRGASTISQQTAKNLFLWSGRNFLRKGLEVWFTALLEWLLGKQRILELYLNIVEFGPGIFGVEAASQQFYAKPAQDLNRREAARLVAVLPNPYRFHVKRPTSYLNGRVLWIEQQMRQLGSEIVNNIH